MNPGILEESAGQMSFFLDSTFIPISIGVFDNGVLVFDSLEVLVEVTLCRVVGFEGG
jgi:hypothetical protein